MEKYTWPFSAKLDLCVLSNKYLCQLSKRWSISSSANWRYRCFSTILTSPKCSGILLKNKISTWSWSTWTKEIFTRKLKNEARFLKRKLQPSFIRYVKAWKKCTDKTLSTETWNRRTLWLLLMCVRFVTSVGLFSAMKEGKLTVELSTICRLKWYQVMDIPAR